MLLPMVYWYQIVKVFSHNDDTKAIAIPQVFPEIAKLIMGIVFQWVEKIIQSLRSPDAENSLTLYHTID